MQILAKSKVQRLCFMQKYTEEAVLEALKTIRKLERFNDDDPVNFEWPTNEQILAMSRDRLI